MDEQDNPVVKFIKHVSDQIFERLIRGQVDYANDLKALEKYRDMARQANAPRREAGLVNSIAVLNMVAGHLELAEEQFTRFYQLQESLGSLSGMVTALNNKGFFLASLGKYPEASALYIQAVTLAETDVTTTFTGYSQALSGQLFIHYMLKQFDEMPAIYDKVIAVQEMVLARDSKTYARLMTEVNRSMAEYQLHHKQYDQAGSLIRTAIDFATGLGLTFELADLYYVQAHEALMKGADPETYWKKAIDILDGVPAKPNVARNYAQEARYLESRGYMEHGRRFAKYAYDIFESLGMSEDIQLTQTLL